MTQLNHTVTLLEDITVSVHKDKTNREWNLIQKPYKKESNQSTLPINNAITLQYPSFEKKKKKRHFSQSMYVLIFHLK